MKFTFKKYFILLTHPYLFERITSIEVHCRDGGYSWITLSISSLNIHKESKAQKTLKFYRTNGHFQFSMAFNHIAISLWTEWMPTNTYCLCSIFWRKIYLFNLFNMKKKHLTGKKIYNYNLLANLLVSFFSQFLPIQ